MKTKLTFAPIVSMILPGKHDKERTVACAMDGGRLMVVCRGCPNTPDIGSRACVKCISGLIAKNGEPERIVLRSGKDIEYFGDAVSIINGLSRIDRLANAVCGEKRTSKKCAICSRSPSKVVRNIWADFPEPDLDKARSVLNGFDPSDSVCEECIMQTYRSLDGIGHALEMLSEDAAMAAFNLTEV